MDKPSTLAPDEIMAVQFTIATPGWATFERLMRKAKDTAIARCVEAPADQRLYQGIAQGMLEVEKVIGIIKNFAPPKEASGS